VGNTTEQHSAYMQLRWQLYKLETDFIASPALPLPYPLLQLPLQQAYIMHSVLHCVFSSKCCINLGDVDASLQGHLQDIGHELHTCTMYLLQNRACLYKDLH